MIEVPAAATTLKGRVTAVASAATPGNGSFAVEIECTNTPERKVKGGMSAVISIATSGKSNGMIVPHPCVTERNGKSGVWIAKSTGPHFVEVVHKSIGQGHSLVTDGLSDGDTVIVSGLSRIREKSPVTVSILPQVMITITSRKGHNR